MPSQTYLYDENNNRVMSALLLYAEQEAHMKINNPMVKSGDRSAMALKLDYYSSVYKAVKKNKTPHEKHSLRFIKSEMSKMKAKLQPTLLKRIWYSRPGNAVRHFVSGNNMNFKVHKLNISRLQQDQVQDYNRQNLSAAIKNAGFTVSMEGVLNRMISQDLDKFHIRYSDVASGNAEFLLDFKKLPGSEVYYFEKFQASSRPSVDSLLNNTASVVHKEFSMLDKTRFTAREAANLVNGKAVCKLEDGKENWVYLDATKGMATGRLEAVNFNLEKELSKLPIQKWENLTYRSTVINTLKSGSSREINLQQNGSTIKYNVEAAPRQRTVKLTDRHNQIIPIGSVKQNSQTAKAKELVEKAETRKSNVVNLDSKTRVSL